MLVCAPSSALYKTNSTITFYLTSQYSKLANQHVLPLPHRKRKSGNILQAFKTYSKKKNKTRMWANVQCKAALQNIGGTLCSTPQSLGDAHY